MMLGMLNGGIIANFSRNFRDQNKEATWNDFRNSIAESTDSEIDAKKLQTQIFSKPQKIEETNPLYIFFSDLTGRFNKA